MDSNNISKELDILIFVFRSIGLNGSWMMLFGRAWLFFYTYKYDKDILSRKNRDNSKIIKYHSTFGNEKKVLIIILSYLIILTTILTFIEIFSENNDGLSEIYFGLSLTLGIILAILMPKEHDQLGLLTELKLYGLLYIAAFIAFVVMQFTLDGNGKTIGFWIGGSLLFLVTNIIAFYISFIYYKQWSRIFTSNNKDMESNKKEENTHVELLKIISHPRTFKPFRDFLSSIMCVENLDFIVDVQYLRSISPVILLTNDDNTEQNNDDINDDSIVTESRDSVNHRKKSLISNGLTKLRNALNKSIDQLSQDEIAEMYFITDDKGHKNFDITLLKMDFAEISDEIKNINPDNIENIFKIIYNKYIPNASDCCLNLPSKMRKKYIKSYDKYSGKLPSKRNIIRDSNIKKLYTIKDNDGNINVDFFNDAQEECWKLIASDSMLHFKTTDVYKHAMYQE